MKPERLPGLLRLSEPAETKPRPLRVVVVQTERDDPLQEEIPENLEDGVPVPRMEVRCPTLVSEARPEVRVRALALVDYLGGVLNQCVVLIVPGKALVQDVDDDVA